jgi:hypothetical protein
MNCELGTITAMFSSVTTVVARAPIRRTSPLTPPTSMRSPTLIGRSKRMMRPLTKLLATFWSPKPSPTPSAPARTVKALRSMPTAWRMTTRPRVVIAYRSSVPTACRTPSSRLRRARKDSTTQRVKRRVAYSSSARRAARTRSLPRVKGVPGMPRVRTSRP